jgi:predicted phage tail protein
VLSGTATAGQAAGTDLAVGTIGTSVAASTNADTFTGGAGSDVFGVGIGAITTMSTITDLNLGTAVVAGGVDRMLRPSTSEDQPLCFVPGLFKAFAVPRPNVLRD